jgi:putative flippase GtrA
MGLSILKSAGRFTVVGGLITVLHIAVATFLVEKTGVSSVTANSAAFVIANVTSYLLHTHWSFAASPSFRSGQRFLVVSLIGFVLTAFLSGTVQWLGLPYWIGIGLVVTIVPANNFLLHRFWTYANEKSL